MYSDFGLEVRLNLGDSRRSLVIFSVLTSAPITVCPRGDDFFGRRGLELVVLNFGFAVDFGGHGRTVFGGFMTMSLGSFGDRRGAGG